ncbi:hypothetical protein BT69DRAFT_368031 [Atractiella rhizophila]|nr:hypothetical protein BT69DRAFT_368031 [Atractiella rhizophila]
MQNAANPPVPNHASDASATSSDNLFDLPPSQEQTHELSHHGTRRVSHHSHHAYTPYEIPNMLIPAHSHPALPSPPSNLYGVPIPMPPLNTNVHPFEFPTTLTPLNTPVEAPPALATPFGVPDPSLNLQNMICQFFGACICGNCSMGSSQPPSETALSLCPEQCGTCPTCMAALGMGGSEVVVRGAALLGNGIMESNGQYFDIEQWLRDGATAGWVDAPLSTGEPNWLDVAAAEGQDVASQSQSTVAAFHGLKPRTAPQESYQF